MQKSFPTRITPVCDSMTYIFSPIMRYIVFHDHFSRWIRSVSVRNTQYIKDIIS